MSDVATIEPAGEVAVVPAHQDVSLLAVIARAASDASIDPDKMQRLLDMQMALQAEQAKREFWRAMAAAQAEMEPIKRGAYNTHLKSMYARLEDIDREIRPIYTRHGFFLSFNSDPLAGTLLTVHCLVGHSGGHQERYTLQGALDGVGAKGASNKTDIQALGSTRTYLQRYLTVGIFNITLTEQDNDGNAKRRGYRDAEPVAAPAPDAPAQPDEARPLTPEEWLANLESELTGLRTQEALDAVLERPAVQEAQRRARGDHRTRLDGMIRAAMQRVAEPVAA